MNISRRQLTMSLAGVAGCLALPQSTLASSALELSVNELVARSDRCIIGQAVAHRSEWLFLGGARRIVTWTRVLQEKNWLTDEEQTDAEQGDEIEVLTLGGRVGTLMQKVSGEAALKKGERSLLFVSHEYQTMRRVIGMAQGHFPLKQIGSTETLQRSPGLPHLFSRAGRGGSRRGPRAVDALHGLTLSNAEKLVRGAR